MAVEPALTALGDAVTRDEACVTVAGVDWPLFAPVFTMARPSPLLAALPEARPPAAGRGDGPGRTPPRCGPDWPRSPRAA
ncbi:hypothetical protein O1L68_05505 [Streptomyces lydicus]|nr:hypothetical protein [Streptomyces lydicus]